MYSGTACPRGNKTLESDNSFTARILLSHLLHIHFLRNCFPFSCKFSLPFPSMQYIKRTSFFKKIFLELASWHAWCSRGFSFSNGQRYTRKGNCLLTVSIVDQKLNIFPGGWRRPMPAEVTTTPELTLRLFAVLHHLNEAWPASLVLLQKKCILWNTLNMFSIKFNAQPLFIVMISGSIDGQWHYLEHWVVSYCDTSMNHGNEDELTK